MNRITRLAALGLSAFVFGSAGATAQTGHVPAHVPVHPIAPAPVAPVIVPVTASPTANASSVANAAARSSASASINAPQIVNAPTAVNVRQSVRFGGAPQRVRTSAVPLAHQPPRYRSNFVYPRGAYPHYGYPHRDYRRFGLSGRNYPYGLRRGYYPGYGYPGYGLGGTDNNVTVSPNNVNTNIVGGGGGGGSAEPPVVVREVEPRPRPSDVALQSAGAAAAGGGAGSHKLRNVISSILLEREAERISKRSGSQHLYVTDEMRALAEERAALREAEGRGRNRHILYLGFDEH